MKCSSYHIRKRNKYLDPNTIAYITGKWPANNGVIKEEYGVCYGTKECEQCSCGGDRTRCDFYLDMREKAKRVLINSNSKELHKQLIFDCAMELFYHTENMSDEDVGNKLMAILKAMEQPMVKARFEYFSKTGA